MSLSGLFRELPLMFLSNTWLHSGKKKASAFPIVLNTSHTSLTFYIHGIQLVQLMWMAD
jgi:hypothetical protein